MKQRPILFSTPMVQAILDGRKTQTRRVVKPQPVVEPWDDEIRGEDNLEPLWQDNPPCDGKYSLYDNLHLCPYGKVGDVLWVRESWQYDFISYPERAEKFYFYKATTPDSFLASGEKWKPSIHMPKEACRLFLQIVDVRAERLQDIGEEDAIREGCTRELGYKFNLGWESAHEIEYNTIFQSLWESINGVESWKANPWVWVVEFKKIQKP